MVQSVLRLPREERSFCQKLQMEMDPKSGWRMDFPCQASPVARFPDGSCVSISPVVVKRSLMSDAVPTGDSGQMRGVVPAVSSRWARPAPASVSCLCRSSCCPRSPTVLQGLKITWVGCLPPGFPRHEQPTVGFSASVLSVLESYCWGSAVAGFFPLWEFSPAGAPPRCLLGTFSPTWFSSWVFPTMPCTLSNRWRVCLVQCWKSQVIKLSSWSLRKLGFLNVFITDRLFQMFCPYFLPLDFIFTSSPLSTCGLLTWWISCSEFLICGALLASSLWQAVSLGHYLAALRRRKRVVRLQSRVFLNRKSEAKQKWYLDYHILLFVGWPWLAVSWGIVLNTSTFYYFPSWDVLSQTQLVAVLRYS